ncbi:hypothetical protein LV779_12665 [Streptomyces thinghirensis]|nr:hypothetical protein [Streptomyces thinghirensis]
MPPPRLRRWNRLGDGPDQSRPRRARRVREPQEPPGAAGISSGFSPTAEPPSPPNRAVGQECRLEEHDVARAGLLWPDMVWLDPEPDTDTESYAYSAQIQLTFQRLRSTAEAYAQPGTGLTGDDVRAGRRDRHPAYGQRRLPRGPGPLRQLVQLADRRAPGAAGHGDHPLRPPGRRADRHDHGSRPQLRAGTARWRPTRAPPPVPTASTCAGRSRLGPGRRGRRPARRRGRGPLPVFPYVTSGDGPLS